MRTEREPNRYEPLNETHRRVAEEEEKREAAARNDHGVYEPLHETHRRVGPLNAPETVPAEQQTPINEAQTFSRESIEADPWTAVYLAIPGDADVALLRHALGVVVQCQGAVADPPGLARHAFEAADLGKDKTREQNLEQATRRFGELDNRLSVLEAEARAGTEPEHDPNSPEARLAAMQKELEEKVRLGRINSSEMIYRLRQFDNQLRVEIEQGGTPSPVQQHDHSGTGRDKIAAGAEQAESQHPQQAEATREEARDQIPEKPSERVPETRIEREAQAAEYEITGRGEMTDARAARLALLRSIDRDIERESHENEGNAPDLGHDAGDHSR